MLLQQAAMSLQLLQEAESALSAEQAALTNVESLVDALQEEITACDEAAAVGVRATLVPRQGGCVRLMLDCGVVEAVEGDGEAMDDAVSDAADVEASVDLKNEVAMKERLLKEKEAEVKKMSDDMHAKLSVAEPALVAAAGALDSLNVKEIGTLKSLKKPPSGIADVTAAVLCLLQTKDVPFEKVDTSWKAAKVMMSPPDKFLETMLSLKQKIDERLVPKSNFLNIQHLLKLEHFDVEILRKKAAGAAGLADFVININVYNDIMSNIVGMGDENRAQLQRAEEELSKMRAELSELQGRLKDLLSKMTARSKPRGSAEHDLRWNLSDPAGALAEEIASHHAQMEAEMNAVRDESTEGLQLAIEARIPRSASPSAAGAPSLKSASVGARSGVKVAVRVRPFNNRERDRDAQCIVRMHGNKTTIINTDSQEEKTFSFDHAFWSHDGFETLEKPEPDLKYPGDGYNAPANRHGGPTTSLHGGEYASQLKVFEDIGHDLLDGTLDGLNSCLFAYGQTGSGKSYSFLGYGSNAGIVPQVCEEIFRRKARMEASGTWLEVHFSMIEIYQEKINDLLSQSRESNLKVRSTPQRTWVEGASAHQVDSYEAISGLMDVGTGNRSVAATQMNAASSRAHIVMTISFKQIVQKDVVEAGAEAGGTKEIVSDMNLIDLASLERNQSSGATGERLKEAAAINKSLLALGNVISSLAERSGNPTSNAVVPYGDSKLTQLLQSALGGNAMTIMVAALSP